MKDVAVGLFADEKAGYYRMVMPEGIRVQAQGIDIDADGDFGRVETTTDCLRCGVVIDHAFYDLPKGAAIAGEHGDAAGSAVAGLVALHTLLCESS